MAFYLVYLVLIFLNGYGHSLYLNDKEEVSIIFFNKSYIEILLKSSNKSMNIWLNPFPTHYITDQKVNDEKCLFEGNVMIGLDFEGTAIISICDQNMTGIFEFKGTTYSLDPVVYEINSSLSSENDISRRKRSTNNYLINRSKETDDIGVCGNDLITEGVITRSKGYEMIPDQLNVTFGRALIKLSIFVDQMIFIHRFARNMSKAMNFVGIHIAYLQKQLQQEIIRRNVDIELVIVHFSVAPFYDTHLWDTFNYLSQFCKWARDNITNFSDINILFTGSQLWWIKEGKLSLSINGLGNVGTVCDPMFACLIIEARNSLISIRTLVHEFAHTLGAQHDGQEKFNTTDCVGDQHIMSHSITAQKTTWSECSAKNMRQLLLSMKRNEQTNQLECLSKPALPIDEQLDIRSPTLIKPGEYVTADEQCQMVYGPKFKYYSDYWQSICSKIKCKDDFLVTDTWPVLEGTNCGSDSECINDQCTRISNSELDVSTLNTTSLETTTSADNITST